MGFFGKVIGGIGGFLIGGPAGASIGMGIGGAVDASMEGADLAKAGKEASQASLAAARETNALKKEMFDIQRADQEPWMKAGAKALETIQATPDFDFSQIDFKTDPSYQFRMDEGINALDRSASSRGRLLSGAQDKAVTRYGQGVASQEYGNAFNRALTTHQTNLNTQKSLAGVGQSATSQVGQAGANMANSVGNTTMNATAQSNDMLTAGATAKANANVAAGNQITNAVGNYLTYSMIK